MNPQRFCACVLLWLTGASTSEVRVTNERILEVMRFAAARSPTFRTLIATIDGANHIVYVDEGVCRREAVRSCVQPGGDGRFLRILVEPGQPTISVARQLAHEFQHVVEIVTATGPTNTDAIRQLYERIGFRSCSADGDCYETAKALEVESAVLREISSRHSMSMNPAFFGVWRLNVDKSSYEMCPPLSGRRFDRDQHHDLASAIVEYVDCLGMEHREAFVYKADGRDYSIRDRAQPLRTIAVAAIDNLTSAFVVKNSGVVVTCGKRTISLDGRVMTIESWTEGEGKESWRTFEFWERRDQPDR